MLGGTIRDFCSSGAAAVAGCSNHPDFPDGAISRSAGRSSRRLGVDDKPGYNNPVSSVFRNATNFEQWYRDTPGVNKTIATTLALNETSPGSGIYEYQNPACIPIDGQGWGNH